MNKTRIDFQVAAYNLQPPKWKIRDCSICGYPLSYVFSPDYEEVGFDSGCDCSFRGSNINQVSWNQVANYYNMQTDENIIKEMNKFWGFK